jgi:hypothetical protein
LEKWFIISTEKAISIVKQMRNVCYPFGRKTVTRKWLDFVNPEGLAYWYQDDGTLNKRKTNDKVTSVEMRIYTYCSEEIVDEIIRYFDEVWKITAKKRFCKKQNNFNVVFNTENSKKFELLIKDFVVPSLEYKLPSNWITRAQDT